jgi:hypothetical protein
VVAEGDGLGGLQVGEARHRVCRVGGGAGGQRGHQVGELGIDPVDRVAHPEAEVGGHLVVAAAPGGQAPAGVADAFGEPGLDVHVDVFEGFAEREGPGLDLGGDLGEAGLDVGLVLRGEDADLHQHRGVGERALDVLPPHLAIEADGGIYLLHHHAGAGGEAATPLGVRLGIAQVGRLGHRSSLILKGRLA